MNETDHWRFIPAKHFKRVGPSRQPTLIVIHDMEAPEGPLTAENVAAWFARGERVASAHLCIDNNSIVQCVWDSDVAYAAPGANHNGLQYELAGYARQTREQWLDPYSMAVLENAARAAAQHGLKYRIPMVRLGVEQVRAGQRGITDHRTISLAFGKSDHMDPGPNFPWDIFLARANHHSRRLPTTPNPTTPRR